MRHTGWLTTAVLLAGSTLLAAEMVGVPGSATRFPSEVEAPIGGKSVKLRLTGTAIRSRLLVNVYSLASYVQADATIRSAEALADADTPKRLHLTMERTVDGRDLAEAFRSAIRMNHAEPNFSEEITSLSQYMRSSSVRKGENILLTHIPGIGLQINVAGKADFLIKNVEFSKAVWEIYLGSRNLGDSIKKGLTSRL
ncbi:MAG: chalcone isomerase family protein [Gemmataceae bacterium]